MSETRLIAHAEALARWLHRKQGGKRDRPYVEHLKRVTAEQVATGWLHDCVEGGHAGSETLFLDNLDPERGDFPGRELLLARHRRALARIEAAMESIP